MTEAAAPGTGGSPVLPGAVPESRPAVPGHRPTGAWLPGDDPGRRQFVTLFEEAPLRLELGGELGPVTVAYETWGRLAPDGGNAALVLHALTGDSHLAGPAGPGHRSPGWWPQLVAPGGPLDPEQWFVVCPNVLGGCQGSTGPASPAPDGRPWGSRFPALTVRDQVRVEAALAGRLGVGCWAVVVGGSMGGMRALEWPLVAPGRVRRAVVIACGAAATAEQIALSVIQARAIRLDPGFAGGDYYGTPGHGPAAGLGLARRLGHVSYRSEAELHGRFGREPQPGEEPWASGRYAVESYLDHQARKLAARFDANSYLVLSRVMDHHDVGRGRGGVAAALGSITADVTVAGVDSDRLYPLRLQYEMAELLPGRPEVRLVSSPAGHDGFLIEAEQIAKIVADALS
jgi:homoserine O-acetyltransferase/O-succinyltransferase